MYLSFINFSVLLTEKISQAENIYSDFFLFLFNGNVAEE